MISLPDVNVWLAMAFRGHEHHGAAKDWFENVPEGGCSFCRLTQQGFLRLSTNPKAFAQEAVSLAKAWRLYDAFLGDPRVSFSQEPVSVEALWRGFTRRRSFSPKVWNDAFLAAFAKAGDFELVTFDKGFKQYKGVNCKILS
jgi:hypothetical protein